MHANCQEGAPQGGICQLEKGVDATCQEGVGRTLWGGTCQLGEGVHATFQEGVGRAAERVTTTGSATSSNVVLKEQTPHLMGLWSGKANRAPQWGQKGVPDWVHLTTAAIEASSPFH